jgi:protein phosphatase
VFVDAPLPEDVYLFCSDGLFRMLADVEIARVLAEHRRDPEKAALTLTLAANAAGGRDNVTVVVLAITSPA